MEILIGLGANLGDQAAALRAAVAALGRDHRVVEVSALYRSRAVGPPQPDFLNAAVRLAVDVPPPLLLAECQQLEAAAGRVRSARGSWLPRPLDLDLLLVRGLVMRGPRLELPHPLLDHRAFALIPAADVAADWRHPLRGVAIGRLADAARRAEPGAVERIAGRDWP